MSLTTTAKNFKRGMKLSAVAAIGYYLVILVVIPKTQDFIDSLNTNKEPPTPIYGQLEPLKFVKQDVSLTNATYVLNTTDGRLPRGIPRKMPVYKFKGVQFSYLGGVRAQEQASFLGFKPEELISDLKGKEFRWRSLVSGGTLTINTETQSIKLDTDLYAKGAEYKVGSIDTASATRYAVGLFKELGLYNEKQYDVGVPRVYLGAFTRNNLVDTRTTAEAQMARVELYRKINTVPVLGADPNKSMLSVTLRAPTDGQSPYNYPLIDGLFWDVETQTDATYPIISAAEAWKQIQSGNGIIVNVTPKGSNPFGTVSRVVVEQILVNTIYLAYYETKDFQKYMQPIYVFQGKYVTRGTEGGDITIYFPAISGQYIKTLTPTGTTTTPTK